MNSFSTITVFEHQYLTERDFVWTTDFDWLLSEELTVFTIKRKQGQWQLKVGHYVGIVLLPSGSMLEILPKPIIEDEGVDKTNNSLAQTRLWVQAMLIALTDSNQFSRSTKNFGHLSAHLAPFASRASPTAPPLSEWLVTQFLQHLSYYRPSSQYQTQIRNETLMQGKLMIKEQLKRNSHQPHKFVCNVSTLGQDAIANRLIKSALVLLEPLLDKSMPMTVLRPWRQIVALDRHERCQLDKVYKQAKYQLVSQSLGLPQRRGAQQLLDLAYWLLKQSDMEAGSGLNGQSKFGSSKMRLCILFNMNQAFEQWASLSIAARLRTINPNYEPLYQAQSLWLSDEAGQTRLSMRPDLLIRHKDLKSQHLIAKADTNLENRYSHVIDIKWKAITQAGAIKTGDAYQLTSYAQAYRAKHIWLVYPVLGDGRQPMALQQRHNIESRQQDKTQNPPFVKLWLMPFNVLKGELNGEFVSDHPYK